MKRFMMYSFGTAFLCVLLLMASCSQKVVYKNDVPASELTKAISMQVPVASGYTVGGGDFLQFNIPDAIPYVDDYSILYSIAANDYTEIGVLHVNENAKSEFVNIAVSNYLKHFKETYAPQASQYDPSEQRKLEDASCFLCGNYVIYTIMTAEEQAVCTSTLKKLLIADHES